jgi:hypothetical protein
MRCNHDYIPGHYMMLNFITSFLLIKLHPGCNGCNYMRLHDYHMQNKMLMDGQHARATVPAAAATVPRAGPWPGRPCKCGPGALAAGPGPIRCHLDCPDSVTLSLAGRQCCDARTLSPGVQIEPGPPASGFFFS